MPSDTIVDVVLLLVLAGAGILGLTVAGAVVGTRAVRATTAGTRRGGTRAR
jgi:hypothetical protein